MIYSCYCNNAITCMSMSPCPTAQTTQLGNIKANSLITVDGSDTQTWLDT